MAASKPISWLYSLNTSLLSLNKNFGTLNTCSGLFPFWQYNLIVKCLIVQHSSLPFREQILANRVFTTPPYAQGITFSRGFPLVMKMHKLSEITVLYLLWCNLNYILTYVSRKTSYSSQDCLSLTYHSSLDVFTTTSHSAFYKPDHGKITTLRVSN